MLRNYTKAIYSCFLKAIQHVKFYTLVWLNLGKPEETWSLTSWQPNSTSRSLNSLTPTSRMLTGSTPPPETWAAWLNLQNPDQLDSTSRNLTGLTPPSETWPAWLHLQKPYLSGWHVVLQWSSYCHPSDTAADLPVGPHDGQHSSWSTTSPGSTVVTRSIFSKILTKDTP